MSDLYKVIKQVWDQNQIWDYEVYDELVGLYKQEEISTLVEALQVKGYRLKWKDVTDYRRITFSGGAGFNEITYVISPYEQPEMADFVSALKNADELAGEPFDDDEYDAIDDGDDDDCVEGDISDAVRDAERNDA